MGRASPDVAAALPPLLLRPSACAQPSLCGLRRPVNWRSIALGLCGGGFICSLTSYNDYVLANTPLVGNYLPVGLLLCLLICLLAINAPLSRWAPRHALDSGELAVALGMMLVGCALPSSGLMRYLTPSLVGMWYHAGQVPDYKRVLLELDLPEWIFPRFGSSDRSSWPNDPVVMNYYLRGPPGVAAPWGAWVRPLLAWGTLIAALGSALLCMCAIVRKQWAENERLPFPLADVYASLIEAPPPGRALNALFSSRSFWIAFAAVFAIHGVNAMNKYEPKIWPQIPIGYDLSSLVFGSAPGWYMDWAAPKGTLYFSIIGIAFFLQSKIAFSLWIFYILFNITRMVYGTAGSEYSAGMQNDQIFGAIIPYTLAILWVGRGHWAMVLRHMFAKAHPDDSPGRYLPYAAAGWGLALSLLALIAWLCMAGASVVGAVVLVAMMMTLFLVMTRIVAETGMIFVQVYVPLNRPWVLLGSLPGSLAARTTMESAFYSSLFMHSFGHDMREALPVYATHAMRIADRTGHAGSRQGLQRTLPFMAALGLALVVGFFIAAAAKLSTEYTYASTVGRAQSAPLDGWATMNGLQWNLLDPLRDYRPPNNGAPEGHDRLAYFSSGVVITSALSILRLRFVGWPLHPVGLLLAYSFSIRMCWFSIFVGWLAKGIILRVGGIGLMRRARPVFIGMIIGEAGAAAFWLAVTLCLAALGIEFHAIQLLPQ